MPITFTPSNPAESNKGQIAIASGYWLLLGTLTFSGSYSTGGDSVDPSAQLGIGGKLRELIPIQDDARGNSLEYDVVNKKLKVFSSANTELAAGAYNAALTAAPVACAFLARIG